jgi:probable addiction module antidote protein
MYNQTLMGKNEKRNTSGNRNMVRGVGTYQEDLVNALKDPREAAAYLNAAIEEGDRAVFLLALRNVAEAQGGMAAVARKAHMNRESLYRMLSSKGNPEIRSILTLLNSMQLRLIVEPKRSRERRYRRRIGSPASPTL